MSSLYFSLGLLGLFVAVSLMVVTSHAWLIERRRAVTLLQAQVADLGDLREQQMAEPFFDRILVPVIRELGQMAKRITPVGMRQRIARQLLLGGNTGTLDADKVAAFKVFGSVAGVVTAFGLAKLAGLSDIITIGAAVFGGFFCYLIPGAGLGQKAVNRQQQMRRNLPDVIDLLTISVEAGLGFDAALAHVRRNVPGALSDEIGRALQEMQLGVPRSQALRSLADRSEVAELRGFVLAMVQADTFGTSISAVLRAQSKELRLRRRQRAEEIAMKVPVKLLLPLILGFLPAMFIVVVGPGVIRLMDKFSALGF
jgi:tight adherence protein C